MSGGIQTSVTTQPAPGIVGAFCDDNPRYSLDAGPGGVVAGPNGLTIGNFAWLSWSGVDGDFAPTQAVNSGGTGPVAGFCARLEQGLNTTYLADAGMTIPAGFMAPLFTSCGVWAKNNGATQALPGMKAYAKYLDGSVTFAPSGQPLTSSGSASSIAAGTSSFTGSISGNILNITAVSSGTIYSGTTISGTGVASGSMVMSQLSGAPGGIGTYALNIPEQTVASTAISGTYGVLTIGGTVAGTFGIGQTLSGSGVVAGTYITAFGTGAGAAGTYIVSNNTTVSSTAITAATNVETSWYARSSGLPGEIVKISNLPGLG